MNTLGSVALPFSCVQSAPGTKGPSKELRTVMFTHSREGAWQARSSVPASRLGSEHRFVLPSSVCLGEVQSQRCCCPGLSLLHVDSQCSLSAFLLLVLCQLSSAAGLKGGLLVLKAKEVDDHKGCCSHKVLDKEERRNVWADWLPGLFPSVRYFPVCEGWPTGFKNMFIFLET